MRCESLNPERTGLVVAKFQISQHQMQADSIAQHLGTMSATIVTYESFVEIVQTFCQTIDHANRFKMNLKNLEDVVKAIILTHVVVEVRVMDRTLEEDGLPPQVLVMEMGELEGSTIVGSLVTSSITWMMQVMNNLFEIV